MRAAIALGVALAVVGCEEPRAPAYTARRIAEDEHRAASQGAERDRNDRQPEVRPPVATDPGGGGMMHDPWFWLFAGQTAYHALKPAPRARAREQHHHYQPAPTRPSSPPPKPAPAYRSAPRPPPRAYRSTPSRAPRSPGYSSRPSSGGGRR